MPKKATPDQYPALAVMSPEEAEAEIDRITGVLDSRGVECEPMILNGTTGPAPLDGQDELNIALIAVGSEVDSGRSKFPGNAHMLAALTEEVGEVARALLEGDAEQVKREAIQVAAVAVRIALEGDADFE